MNILGINAYHGDASAALLIDGQLVAAVEEERFTRVKHDTAFPHEAIRYCLESAGMRPHDVDHIALSRDPFANLGKRVAPRGAGPGRAPGGHPPRLEPAEGAPREAAPSPKA